MLLVSRLGLWLFAAAKAMFPTLKHDSHILGASFIGIRQTKPGIVHATGLASNQPARFFPARRKRPWKTSPRLKRAERKIVADDVRRRISCPNRAFCPPPHVVRPRSSGNF